jgi:hypothetical protein
MDSQDMESMIDQSPFIIYSGANFDLEWRPSYVPTFNHVFRPNGAKLTRPGHRPGFAYHKKLQAPTGRNFLACLVVRYRRLPAVSQFSIELLKLLRRQGDFLSAWRSAINGALAPVHGFVRHNGFRDRFSLHHHILALLDPSDDGVQVVPEILKRGRFHTHLVSCRPNPVKT